MPNDVTFERADYKAALYAWSLVDDVVEGQKAVKDGGKKYLPMPMPKDVSPENQARYDQYLSRAVLYGATGRTLNTLVGAAFRKVPVATLVPDLTYVEDDIDGSGLSIYQQSQDVLKAVLKRGRHALLVDYPQVEGPISRLEQGKGYLRSTVASISARNVINWRTEKVGAKHKLSMVVVREFAEEETEDGFGVEIIEQYRVLRLSIEGYTQEVWRQTTDKAGGWQLHISPFPVLDGAGKQWDEIPFMFVGANNNDPWVDPSPLLALAEKEIAHYQVSADCRHSAYMTGQAQPVFTGISQAWADENKQMYFGSSTPICLPENATAQLLQTAGNTQAEREREYLDKMIQSLGARLVEPGSAVKTATQAESETAEDHSVLSLAVSNVSEAYIKALEWMQRFLNITGEVDYQINQEFTRQTVNTDELREIMAGVIQGNVPMGDYVRYMKKHGIFDQEKPDEEYLEELAGSMAGPRVELEA